MKERCYFLDRVLREKLSDKVTPEHRPEMKEDNKWIPWRKNLPGIGTGCMSTRLRMFKEQQENQGNSVGRR